MFGPLSQLHRGAANAKAVLTAALLGIVFGLSGPAAAANEKYQRQSASSQKLKASATPKPAAKPPSVTPRRPARTSNSTSRRPKAVATAPAWRGGKLLLESDAIVVLDERTGTALLEKNAGVARPIASITKLMTAMVILDAGQPLKERIQVSNEDVDRVKYSSSRLAVGTTLTREQMLHLALMSSENRAAHSLGRTYPGGMKAFVKAMNAKARSLGMKSAKFVDPTGLDARNVASAKDLATMVSAAADYPLIRRFSTDSQMQVAVARKQQVFRNTNPLVQRSNWDIDVSKTGYIREAGRCLVMHAKINNRETLIVLMDGHRNESRIRDSMTVRKWLERPDQRTTLKAADLMINDTVG